MWDVVARPEHVPALGSDTTARIVTTRGAAAANLAVALRRALTTPADVVYVGCAGADEMGRRFADDLRRNGVDPQFAWSTKPTGTLISLVDGSGERTMLTDRGANDDLTSSDVLGALSDDLRHLHLSGYTVLQPHHGTWIGAILHEARDRGATTSVDVCSWYPLTQLGPEEFLRRVAGVDLLFANENEALSLTGATTADDAIRVLGARCGEVVVTRGEEGAMALRDGVRATSPSRAREVLDTTGAGDAATGAYLAWRLNGHDVSAALDAAMASAAEVVGGLGSAG
jgi:sugar/nucleoside kinase (ribokinase family)